MHCWPGFSLYFLPDKLTLEHVSCDSQMSTVVFIHKIHCVTHTLRHQHNNTSINPLETTQTKESPLLSLTQGALVAGETPYEDFDGQHLEDQMD